MYHATDSPAAGSSTATGLQEDSATSTSPPSSKSTHQLQQHVLELQQQNQALQQALLHKTGDEEQRLQQRCAVLIKEREALQSILQGKLQVMAESVCSMLQQQEHADDDDNARACRVTAQQLSKLLGATITALKAPGGGG